jgi:hypothetical protein
MAEPSPPKPSRLNDSLKWVLQTLAMPVALVTLPLLYQWKASEQADRAREESRRRDQAEQQFRLYTDLMSKREESDTAVRRGLFDKLMGTYLAPNPGDIGKRLVALELLSLNFHDSLNLSPLFWELANDIEKSPTGARRNEHTEQLDRVAAAVKQRQAALLEVDGGRGSRDVVLAHTAQGNFVPETFGFDLRRIPDDASPAGAAVIETLRHFDVTLLDHDAKRRRLAVRVASPGMDALQFWLDPYDFPLVNFSRISRHERIAVVLLHYDVELNSARVLLLYFPSWRSGAKDKPYLDDLMVRLTRPPASAAGAPPAGSAASNR